MTAGCTTYTPSGTWPDLDGSAGDGPLEIQDDGQVLNHAHTFRNDSGKTLGTLAKLIDAADYLKKHADDIAVAAYSGAQYTITAGPLGYFLHLVANSAARVDATINTFVGIIAFAKALRTTLGTITNAATANIGVASAFWVATAVSQQIDTYALDADASDGDLLFVSRDAAGAFPVVVHREGQAAAIVTLPSSTATGAILVRRAGTWRLFFAGLGATAGAHA